MERKKRRLYMIALLSVMVLPFIGGTAWAYLSPSNPDVDPVNNVVTADQIQYMPASYLGHYSTPAADTYTIGPGSVPDYLTSPNWAYSPPLRKFVDTLPLLGTDGSNNLGQYIPVANPDTTTYPGSDYYEIELVEHAEQMHSDLPPVTQLDPTIIGGTRVREYRQVNNGTNTATGGAGGIACTTPDPANPLGGDCTTAANTITPPAEPHFLGPVIIARTGRAVRVKFINNLPKGSGGDLFIPVDTSIMGAGPFEINYDPVTKAATGTVTGDFSQNRALLHLHGGRTPWISDGTPHQWITPANETNPNAVKYPTGVSVENVPDMPDPGDGAQTYYWTNQQSSRFMFYHDHAWGITRLNVYIGEAAGYVIRDTTEQLLIDNNIIPSGTAEIPLVIMDKTFVDADKIASTDPTWNWGTNPGTPVEGDLWWPHVYMPAQNPFDISGIAPMGRWAYGPYFWPPTNNTFQPIPNPYYDSACDPGNPATPGSFGGFCQPPEIPSSPNPSWGAEAFMDTPVVNGTAYPVLDVDAKAYRFRILNASHDRFLNLHWYIADTAALAAYSYANTPSPNPNANLATAAYDANGYGTFANSLATRTEVRMVTASPNNLAESTVPTEGPYSGGAVLPKPNTWPEDGRPGGVPDWSWVGPEWVMIGNEGGFLPRPVVIPNNPVGWNADVTTFNAGNVNTGSLILGPAERADVIVDFRGYENATLILYNDAPAPWPAIDPHYDYYTDAPDNTPMGGYSTTAAGWGPNTRTIMQVKVSGVTVNNFDMTTLTNEFDPATNVVTVDSVFTDSQDTLIAGQGNMNSTGDPAYYESFAFGPDAQYNTSTYNTIYNKTFPATYPDWGVARIFDEKIKLQDPITDVVTEYTMEKKAIQDEQGETFDEFGRMRAGLGLTQANPGAGQVNFILQSYSDPSSEVLAEDEVQVWKITHNGVDTHPIHFHLFDVQVLNRVGWDGFIRLPDPTEIGWKDTVRISPLEDTIVALKPVTPTMKFGIPESIRPLNPARPLGDGTALSLIDPVTGQIWADPNVNRMYNLDWEYVWHCHILSHEENDMMRPISFQFAETLSPTVLGVTVTPNGPDNDLTWTDPTPVADPGTLGNHANEIAFRIERSINGGAFTYLAFALANATSYTDASAPAGSRYHVFAVNAAGSSTLPLSAIELGVFNAALWTMDSNGNRVLDAGVDSTYSFGLGTDKPVTGDWTGTGVTRIGLFRNGTWLLDINGNGVWDSGTDRIYRSFGMAGDIPVTGDWNGDGTTEIGVFRNGVWLLDTDGNGVWNGGSDARYTGFGLAGDIPVTGNWNGDLYTEIGVYRNGTWLLDMNGNGAWNGGIDVKYSAFGLASDIPVTGDWDSDGTTEIGVYRNGIWYLDVNGNGAWNGGIDVSFTYGTAADTPVTLAP